MYHTTGFAKDEIIDLCALVYANEENCDIDPWPPSLGLYKSVVIALTYMRRNRVQQELAETYKTSQPTISRANSRITSIANFKTWRIMHTDYRRPLDTFDTTISAVVGLHFYRMA
jgi:hypothetical protein